MSKDWFMNLWLKRLTVPPTYPDETQTAQARLIFYFLWISIAIKGGLLGLSLVLPPPIPLPGFYAVLLFATGLDGGCLWLVNRGHARWAGQILSTLLWGVLLGLAANTGGVSASVFPLVMAVPVIAGVIVGGRASLVWVGVNSLASIGLVLAAQAHWLPFPPVERDPWLTVVIIGLTSLILASAQWVSTRVLQRALKRVVASETALQRAETIYRQAIMAAGAVPYYLDNRTDTYTFMGDGILQMTGYSASEMTPAVWETVQQEGFPRGKLAHLSYAEADELTEADAGILWECDYRIRTRDGQTRWVADTSVKGFNEQGEAAGVVGILQDITERKQGETRMQATVQGLRAVVEAADELLRAPAGDSIYRRAVELGREKLGLERCALFLIDPTQTYLQGTYGTDAQGHTADERGARVSLVAHAHLFEGGEKRWAVSASQWMYWEGGALQQAFGEGWVVGTPINSVHGPMALFFNDAALTRAPLNEAVQETVAVYCSMLGNILERKQAEMALTEQTTETAVLYQASARLAQSALYDLPTLAQQVTDIAVQAFGCYHSRIWLVRANGLALYGLVFSGAGRLQVPDMPLTGPGLTVAAFHSGEPVYIPDVRLDERYVLGFAETRTELVILLRAQGGVIGVLNLEHPAVDAFKERARRALIAFAEQAALVIENAQLYQAVQTELAERTRAENEARRQLNELSVLHAISLAAAEAVHEDELLARAVSIISDQLYSDIIGILLTDPETGGLRPHPASRGIRPELLQETVPPGIGIIGQVAQSGQAWRLVNVHIEPTYIPLNPNIQAEVCVPLKVGERVLGVINMESERVAAFSEADERLLSTIAGQLATALERLRAQAELRALNAHLERRVAQRTAQLEAANQELEAFSYSVSHDLRAPLRPIDGFARIVLEDYAPQLPAEAQQYLQRIRHGAKRMGALIDDLLAFSRLGRQALIARPVDTGALVRAVWQELQHDLANRPVEMIVGDLPMCEADSALLKQVWVNLLANALKYSSKRETARVEVGWTGAAYFVRDNGAGFDMRYADKLFGVFQRLHRQEEFEGTGVGLANVRRIVERHGGRVWAEAEVDQGATFYFTLA